MNNRKVVIIGDGMVGSSIAFSLVNDNVVNELVIIDANKNKAEGDALDLMHGLPFVSPKKIKAGDYSDIKDAHIVILSAGVAQKVGETRLQLLNKNITIFDSILSQMQPYLDDEAVVLVVTNPVDILSYFTYKKLNISSNRVIGSGTVLDTARFKTIIAQHVNIDPRNVHSFVLGEHGDSEVAIYSLTTIGGIPIDKYCDTCKKCENKNLKLMSLHKQVKDAAYEIIAKKGATYYAVALAVNHIVKAILNDSHSILTVSTYIKNEFSNRVKNIYFSLPCVIGKEGVIRLLKPQYNDEEIEKLVESGNIISNEIKSVNL